MMTFFGMLAWMDAVQGAASGEAVPTTSTRLTVLAFEIPRTITPAMAGLTVGAAVGVIGFIAVMLLVGRSDRRRHARRASVMPADQVVFIPPYGTMHRDTPLPPQAFATPGRGYGPPPFVPSSELSARVFAKMGYAADVEEEAAPYSIRAAEPQHFVEVDMNDDADAHAGVEDILPPSVSRSPDSSAPHPLGIIRSTSAAMRAAPIADLSFDDGPTEIGEPYFDEPPQPRRRTDPPKIRAVAPSGPRFPEETPLLPRVTPPPVRGAYSPRS